MDYEQIKVKRKEWVLEQLDLSREMADEEIYGLIDRGIQEEAKEQYIPLHQKSRLRNELFHSIRGLDVLQELIEREEITEIMINGYNRIFVEEAGKIRRVKEEFESKEKLDDVIQQVVAGSNRIVNEASPIVDARLKDGSRVNVVLPPVALDGATMTIRKFPKEAMTMERLIEIGSLPQSVAKVLELFVLSGYNIFISGGTGSGKTTFLNALSNYVPADERIITIEDSAELKIKGVDNLVRLEVRNANVEGANEISMKDLIKSALRMRPDRIIVGEVRGEEALQMLQAMNTGHDGSISTGHANSSKDMLTRLETMVLMGVNMPLLAIRQQIASAIDIIIQLGRLRDRSRRVLQIVEVDRLEGDTILLNPLYEFVEKGEEDNRVQGKLIKVNELKHTHKLISAGLLKEYEERVKK